MGTFDEVCPSLPVAEKSVEDLQFYHLSLHTKWPTFDPYNRIRMVVGKIIGIRCIWNTIGVILKDEYEFRKRIYSRLPL